MESNTFLFNPTKTKIGHSQVSQDQVASTYIQKYYTIKYSPLGPKTMYQTSIFDIIVSKKCKSSKSPKAPTTTTTNTTTTTWKYKYTAKATP